MPSKSVDNPIILFENQAAWTKWLRTHHEAAPGIWMMLAKKASPLQSITYDEALDEALCYGWIDGQKKSYDQDSWLQRFTPRGPRSSWSKRNREHVERLLAEGRMQPAGLQAVKAAKADGRWDRAYDSPGSAQVPDDFKKALEKHPRAKTFFDTLKSGQRYSFLYRIQTAIKPETRARRIAKFVAMLEREETING